MHDSRLELEWLDSRLETEIGLKTVLMARP